MYTIHGQIITTTNTDLHGERLTKEELYHLFEQMADPYIMNQEHDTAKPPICKGYNKKFYQLADGEWAISMDIDVFDEEQFKRYKGFSITFSNGRYTVNQDNKPDIEIRFNPRIFDRDDILKMAELSTEAVQIDVVELKQKGWEVPAIIFLSFATGAIASGFFSKFGGDIYDVVKKQIIQVAGRLKKDKNVEPIFNITFYSEYQNNPLKVIISAKLEDFPLLEEKNNLVQSLLNYITKVIGALHIHTIALEVCDNDPKWKIIYYIDMNGNTFMK